MLYYFDYDMVHGFVTGLVLTLRFELKHLIAARCFFSQVIDHARDTERAYSETFRGGGKRSCY